MAILVPSLTVLVLCVATWQSWPYIQFWWRFEAIGLNAQGLLEYRHRQTRIVFVRLPGGTFNMGSSEGAPYYTSDQGPLHEVTLSPFMIGKFEVTQGRWNAVMGSNPSGFDGTMDMNGNPVSPPESRDRLPVERVSWDDIQEFERKTGLRLPTEAQWEYACRGGMETAFSFGSGDSCADGECTPCAEADPYMWYCANSGKRTRVVGGKKANPFGLHDLHGNVSEWVEDEYSRTFYSTPAATRPDPLCASGSVGRGLRGGSWSLVARFCRSAKRGGSSAKERYHSLGFRVAYWPLP